MDQADSTMEDAMLERYSTFSGVFFWLSKKDDDVPHMKKRVHLSQQHESSIKHRAVLPSPVLRKSAHIMLGV